eukprot:TRINITY_DN21568_c0_g1_i1.p3 TRINITY_DN21568_c0_g1~~TRINITY_DN21568_c0_g1_i1.p3  ORF type:complete len:106 (+),score=32.57 TRINITY_DN21568_c0_g1_i1:89-406(+)
MGGSSSTPANTGEIDGVIAAHPLVVFQSSYCPYCSQAVQALRSAGLQPHVVEVSAGIKGQLRAKTGQSSVPQVFAKGQFVGGCNDGGLGGTLPLLRSGRLQQLLK